MKKLVLFAAVVSAFSFASCKKSYTCTCKATGYEGVITGKDTSKKSKSACDDEQERLKKQYPDVSCTL